MKILVRTLAGLLFIAASVSFAKGGNGGDRGGGDMVVCDSVLSPRNFLVLMWEAQDGPAGDFFKGYAAEFFPYESVPSWILQGIEDEKILDAILTFAGKSDSDFIAELARIRANLKFEIVIAFSQKESPLPTGLHVRVRKFTVNGCRRVFAAKQYFNENRTELLKEDFDQLDHFNRAILKFHELALNRFHFLHPTLPLPELEEMARDKVSSFLAMPRFFSEVISRAAQTNGVTGDALKEVAKNHMNTYATMNSFFHSLNLTGLCSRELSDREIRERLKKSHYSDFAEEEKDLCDLELLPL